MGTGVLSDRRQLWSSTSERLNDAGDQDVRLADAGALDAEDDYSRPGVYSRPLRIAVVTRGLSRPCITARTQRGLSSGA